MRPTNPGAVQRKVRARVKALCAPYPDSKCPVAGRRTVVSDTSAPCRSCSLTFGNYLQVVQ